MYDNLNLIIICAALILSLIFFLNLKFISQKLKVFDTPDKKLKIHKKKIVTFNPYKERISASKISKFISNTNLNNLDVSK